MILQNPLHWHRQNVPQLVLAAAVLLLALLDARLDVRIPLAYVAQCVGGQRQAGTIVAVNQKRFTELDKHLAQPALGARRQRLLQSFQELLVGLCQFLCAFAVKRIGANEWTMRIYRYNRCGFIAELAIDTASSGQNVSLFVCVTDLCLRENHLNLFARQYLLQRLHEFLVERIQYIQVIALRVD